MNRLYKTLIIPAVVVIMLAIYTWQLFGLPFLLFLAGMLTGIVINTVIIVEAVKQSNRLEFNQ